MRKQVSFGNLAAHLVPERAMKNGVLPLPNRRTEARRRAGGSARSLFPVYPHSPVSGEVTESPREALVAGYQVPLANLGVLRVFNGVSECFGDTLPLYERKAVWLMNANLIRRFLRLALENPVSVP